MTIRRIAGRQGRLLVDEAGAPRSAAVVFVHCDCGAHAQWHDTLIHVRATRRGIAFDLRGHGASDPARNGDYSIAGRAEDIGTVLDALDISRVILVGHSGGAICALHYAANHVARVAALLLVDPASDARQLAEERRNALLDALQSPAWSNVLLDYYGSIAGTNAAVREQVLADAAHTPQATVVGVFRALSSYDPMPALRGYTGPRLALVSEMGDNPAALHRLDATLPHEVMAGVGHWLHLDAPVAFRARLDDFARTL